MRRHELWGAILACRTDVDRQVASAMGDYPDRAPVRPASSGVPFQEPAWRDPGATTRAVTEVPGASPVAGGSRTTAITDDERRLLAELNRRVQERIASLGPALAHEPGRDDVLVALVLYFDERIMGRLPDYLRLSWPLLQIAYTRSTTGGDDFYRFVNERLAKPSTPSLVLETYYFCLEQGFVGRYANDLAGIEHHQRLLRESIELPRISSETADTTAEVSTAETTPVSAWGAYAISLLVVVLVTASLTLLSNL